MTDSCRPESALSLAGGWCWFTHVERIERGRPSQIVDSDKVPVDVLDRLTRKRSAIAGLTLDQPRIMGILNVTPDSFSDGGQFTGVDAGLVHAHAMEKAGADIIDIGGESTRPGAETAEIGDEIRRTAPVLAAIRAESAIPLSIDTRKSAVARAAVLAGASMINDVSAFGFDPELAQVAATSGLPVCLMHAQGDPRTMQDNPFYNNVALDVFDFLKERIQLAEQAGISRDRIIVDPGIGFGKTLQHNVTLLRSLSLYHGTGCAILLGASRKRFIGTLSGVAEPRDRMAGSVAVALHGVAQGVHILRVHDTKETRQALSLQQAMMWTQ